MWIVYDNNLGIETFASEEEALAEARSQIESYRESAACEGWSEEARSITVSKVTHKVVITDLRGKPRTFSAGMDSVPFVRAAL